MRAQGQPLGRLNEAEFTTWFLGVADTFGWSQRYHTYRSKKSQPGFPDWTLICPKAGAILFVELKGWDTAVKPTQIEWINGLRTAGMNAHLWRPRHSELALAEMSHPIHELRTLPPLTFGDWTK
jgi:hypothetical protein